MELRNRFHGIDSSSLCSQAGRYDNPIPTRFIATIEYLKIPALLIYSHIPTSPTLQLPSADTHNSILYPDKLGGLSSTPSLRLVLYHPGSGGSFQWARAAGLAGGPGNSTRFGFQVGARNCWGHAGRAADAKPTKHKHHPYTLPPLHMYRSSIRSLQGDLYIWRIQAPVFSSYFGRLEAQAKSDAMYTV
jgi:hypothetical protein